MNPACLDYRIIPEKGKAVLIWSSGTLQLLGVSQEQELQSPGYVEVQLELNLFARVPLSCAKVVNSNLMLVGNEDGSVISFNYSLVLKKGHVDDDESACIYHHHTLPISQLAVPVLDDSQGGFFLSGDINWQAAIWKMNSSSAPLRVINLAEVGIREWLLMRLTPSNQASSLSNIALYILTEQERVERIHL